MDQPETSIGAPGEQPSADWEHPHRPGRKRKVKRSSRVKKKLPLIIGLLVAWLIIMALWYYLVNLGQRPPAEQSYISSFPSSEQAV